MRPTPLVLALDGRRSALKLGADLSLSFIMSGRLEVDESGFPIVRVTFRGRVDASVLATYFDRVEAWSKERRRYATILDISQAEVPSAAERKLIADGMVAHQAEMTKFCAGTAIVLTSALLRGAVTAILWVQPRAPRHAVVATRAEGKVACAGWLARVPASRR